jgi:acyl carrier protein
MENEIKQFIIDTLNLEDISINDIDSNAPLFEDGLGLDSIDALELGVALKKKYNITIEPDNSNNREYFSSVKNLTDFILSQQGQSDEGN